MKTDLLSPANSAIIFIDFQPQMTFGVVNIDRQTLFNNVILLAKTAKIFKAPAILTTVESKSFSGNMWPQILDIFPEQKPIERSSMNSWEDEKFVAAVKATGKKKLIMAALWTEVCLAFPALEAMKAGYEVYAVEDASGGTSLAAQYCRHASDRAGGCGADDRASGPPRIPAGLGTQGNLQRGYGGGQRALWGLWPGGGSLYHGAQRATQPERSVELQAVNHFKNFNKGA